MAVDAAAKTNPIRADVKDSFVMAKKHGVTLRTLRFYEAKGLIAPRREDGTRSRVAASISSPATIVHSPPLHVEGKE